MPTPDEFIGKPCIMLFPNGRWFAGNLESDGNNFGFHPGKANEIGCPREAISEVRMIEVDESVNLIRAVLVIKVPEQI